MADPVNPAPAPAVDPNAPAPAPAKNWFAKLDPAYRALLVLIVGTAINIAWSHFFPGVPVPVPVPVPPAPAVQSAPPVVVVGLSGPPVVTATAPAGK